MEIRPARLLLAAAAVSLAVFVLKQPERVWHGTGDFDSDQRQCKAEAAKAPNANHMHVALLFEVCMYGRGWELIAKPH